MGSLGAQGFAEQVEEGNVQLVTALHWHLTANHYPPHPSFMVPLAVAAVEAGQDEEWDRELDLPRACVEHRVILTEANQVEHEGHETDSVVEWRDRTDGKVRASDVIESFHLDSFL